MKAVFINKSLKSNLSLKEAIAAFFKENTPESATAVFWKLLQCWTLKDCKIKAEISDEEIALFMDQLINLVTAAYTIHQANRATLNNQEVKDNA